MAATLLDNQVTSGAPSTSLTITFASTPAAGDLLLAFVGHSDDYPNVPSGWTQISESVQSGVLRLFTKTAAGNEASVNFTAPSPGGFVVRVLRYSGLGALDDVSGGAASVGNQINFGTLNTSAASTLIIAGGIAHGNTLPTGDMVWGNSFTALAADSKSAGTGKQIQLGVSKYTASASGTYTTTASYVPTSTTSIEGIIVAYAITASQAPSTGTMATVTSSTGWTPTGGTMQQVLADGSDSTIATSPDNPTNSLLDGILSPLSPPAGNFTVRLRARKLSSSNGSIAAKLYEGATLRSTVTVNILDNLSAVDIIFPANEISMIASSAWASGLRLTLEATAV